jgi:hypothetical protein
MKAYVRDAEREAAMRRIFDAANVVEWSDRAVCLHLLSYFTMHDLKAIPAAILVAAIDRADILVN